VDTKRLGTKVRQYGSANVASGIGRLGGWYREAVWAASIHPNHRVLDAYCGPGGIAIEASAQLGPAGRLMLVDRDPLMVHEARKRLGPVLTGRGPDRPRAEFLIGDVLGDDPGLGQFDVVFVSWGLRHADSADAAFARLRSLLKPGGSLALMEFTRTSKAHWASPLRGYLTGSETAPLTAPELFRAMKGTGFTVGSHSSHFDGLVTIVAATAP
jgi:ubiquinone/menaquinone biosynthesis C-methylase UbiE